MSTDCCDVEICVVQVVPLLAVCAPFYKLLDCFISTVLYRKGHQFEGLALKLLVENTQLVVGIDLDVHVWEKVLYDMHLVLDDSVVHRQEELSILYHLVSSFFNQQVNDLQIAIETSDMEW